MSEEQQKEVVADTKGAGAILKEARERVGLSSADIAAKLHLKVVNIEALERDEYDPAVSMTFTKGYLKLYAKQVQVAEQVVLDAFAKQSHIDKEPAKLQSFSKRVANQANDDRLMMLTYAIIAIVIAMIIVWWLQRDTQEMTNTITTSPAVSAVTSQGSNQASETLDDNPITPTADDISTEPTEDDITVSEQYAAEQDTVEEDSNEAQQETAVFSSGSESEPAVVPIELVFEFSTNCWMSLSDSTGEAIAYGTKMAGRVMTVSGLPPFEVTLCTPDVVNISYDGMAVDLSRFNSGATAKFSLPFNQ